MPNKLGEAVLVLKANAKGLTTGLKKAQTETTSRIGKMQKSFQGFAKRIPVVGGALAGLATPAGLATAAIAGCSTGANRLPLSLSSLQPTKFRRWPDAYGLFD